VLPRRLDHGRAEGCGDEDHRGARAAAAQRLRGSIGYIGFDGNMDSNIAIRTLVQQGGRVYTWAGGGVVADSELDAEYQESLDKAAAMLAVMGETAL
jgi:hypothetical protein